MKTKHLVFPNLLALALVMQASADVIYSNLQNIAIPATFDGLYLNVETGAWNTNMAAPVAGWDINPYYGGRVLANSPDFQPVRSGTNSSSSIVNLAAGASVGTSSVFSTFVQGVGGETPGAPGYGFSQMLTGSGGNFTAGQEGHLGFRLNGTNYGSMRVVFTDNAAGAMIKDWAYDNTGAAIKTAWITTDIVSATSRTVILNPGTSESFTLGSSLANSSASITNGVLKSGLGITTFSQVNTYTGGTRVDHGTLTIASAGRINTSSGVTVAAGAKFVYNSSTSLSVATTLHGDTTANRAVLGGTGTIGTSVILDNLGDTLAPGNSPGIQNYTAAQSWSSFSYDWEVNNFTGTTAGTDFDQIGLGSTLELSGGSGSYILNVIGLNALNENGFTPDFSEINRSWTILTSTGTLSGFNAANWTINTAGFTDLDTGSWTLDQSGNTLVLSYTVIPEPRAALLGGLGLLMLLRRRK